MNYSTALQCHLDPSGAPLSLRVYSPPHDVPLPDNTIVYVVGRACTSPTHRFIETFIMEPIPGNPSEDEDYDARAPDAQYPVISILGRIVGVTETLPGDGCRAFVVKAFSHICNEMQESRIKCVLEKITSRWDSLVVPSEGTTVYVTGRCRHLCATGDIAISVDEITLDIAPPPNTFSTGSYSQDTANHPEASQPTKKRKRFNAFPPPSIVGVPETSSITVPHASPNIVAPSSCSTVPDRPSSLPRTSGLPHIPTDSAKSTTISSFAPIPLDAGDVPITTQEPESSVTVPSSTEHSSRRSKGKSKTSS